MKLTKRQLRRIIREAFKGNQPLPSDRADMLRGARYMGVVHAGQLPAKNKPTADAEKLASSREERIRYALHKIPFDEYGDYTRALSDTLEKFGIKRNSEEDWAWTEWYQQSGGLMNAWHVKNTIPDYTDVPSHWPTKWLKSPGKPESGFYSR